MNSLLFGTSGWSYKEWVGPFYEKSEKKLSYYTQFFQTTEINSTFYRYPSRSTVNGFYRTSPESFKFSAKLPKPITHEKKLNLDLKVKNDLLRFPNIADSQSSKSQIGMCFRNDCAKT